eukprot:8671590-Karenia_brevis.AAC.1
MATDAAKAARQNDLTQSFRIVKILAGTQFATATTIWDKDGNCISDPDLIKLRWQEHFTDVFGARVVKQDCFTIMPP